jgi:cytidylate kinase
MVYWFISLSGYGQKSKAIQIEIISNMQPTQANLERIFAEALQSVQERNGRRPIELGHLVVVGGPGGTGLSSVARRLAEKLNLTYVYAGDILRRFGVENGFEDIEEFVKSDLMKDSQGKFDIAAESEIIRKSQQPMVLIDSKVFAALSTILEIPTSIKIWVTASIDVRTHRVFEKYGLAKKGDTLDLQSKEYKYKQQKLINRQSLDAQRFYNLYGIEYAKQDQYNDIIVDSSNLDLDSTVNHLLTKLKSMGITNDDNNGVNVTPPNVSTTSTLASNPSASQDQTNIEDIAQVDTVHPEDLQERWNNWKCMVCGYMYEGSKPLTKCPKCGNEDPDKFD